MTPQNNRSTAEVAVGLSRAQWQKTVNLQRNQKTTAVRVRQILVQTEEMAKMLTAKLKQGERFEQLAAAASTCAITRDKGGDVGWSAPADHHLDEYFPHTVRKAAMDTKPGDVIVESSECGIHLVQVVDVFQTLMIDSQPRTRALPGRGIRPAPLIELLRSGHDGSARQLEASTGNGVEPAGALMHNARSSRSVQLTYTMDSMGCQMNTADAERMEGQLRSLGFKYASKPDDAHVVVLNTCSIREHAEAKVYSYLGPHASRKRNGEDLAIVVAGCVAQQEGEALLRRVPEIDLVMGPQYANRLGDLLEGVFNGHQIVATAPTHIMEDMTQPHRSSIVCAWVNVIYGCNERCTYCVVPTTRGVEQSRPIDAILSEVEDLVAQGYREVTLLGQNIDSWGTDFSPRQTFALLLREVGKVPGLSRLRFVTSHPKYMSPRVIDAVAETPAACEMFHIPVQSGDDAVLRDMERGYSVAKFKKIVANIRERVPDAAITSDVIVGFPGETEEQFEATLKLMEEVKFDQLNTAAYSPRPNTPAAKWPNQVDEAVKKARLQRINRLAAEHALERRQRYIGQVVEVLVEGRNPKHPGQVKGRNRQGCPVFFEGDAEALTGQLVPVRIVEALSYSLFGEMQADRFAGGRYVSDGAQLVDV